MKTITLINMWDKEWPKDEPLFVDFHMYDIPETMKLAIYNAPKNVAKMSFGVDGMPDRWQKLVERWCHTNDIEAVWWSYPKDEH